MNPKRRSGFRALECGFDSQALRPLRRAGHSGTIQVPLHPSRSDVIHFLEVHSVGLERATITSPLKETI